MTASRLEYLFKRHFEKRATPEERSELLRLLQDDANEQQLNELVDQALLEDHAGKDMDEATAASIIASIIQVDRPNTPVLPIRHNPGRRKWIYAAAAVLITVMAGLTYLFSGTNKQHTPVAVNNQSHDIPPGNNRATLTLANGETVDLDSAGNRVIRQGAVTINQHHGQLQYEVLHAEKAMLYNTLTTPRGGQFNIVLPDSTRVWLNAASSLKYPVYFTGNERRVELTGEGYFEVAKNKSKPFLVKTGRQTVQVLGTHFNIMAYANENTVKTTLVEGSVKVIGRESSIVNRQSAVLYPGQQAVLTHDSRLTIHDNADIEEALAWKNGVFLFRGADLPVILRQFERWYNIDILYKGQKRTFEFTGKVPRTAHLSSILKLLEVNDIAYTLEKNKLIIQP